MKKIKNICKRAIAVVEVAALTMALTSGLSIVDTTKVSAATSKDIAVNERVAEINDTEDVYSADTFFEFGDVGDEIVLEPIVYDSNMARVDVEEEGLLIFWYKVTDSSIEELGFQTSYTIQSLEQDDYVNEYYYVVSRDGETPLTEGMYIICGSDMCVRIEEPVYYASVGDELTLSIEPKDYYGDLIDIPEDDCPVSWGKIEDGTLTFLSSEPSYVIDSVQDTDFEKNGAPTYMYVYTTMQGLTITGFVHIYEDDSDSDTTTQQELTLNEGTSVTASGEQTLSFTAPEAGNYYFYSKTEEVNDMYGRLVTSDEELSGDDSILGMDFLIAAELEAGETCELIVGSYYGDYETAIYVVDEATADSTVVFASYNLEYNLVEVSLGDSTTLEMTLMTLSEKELEELPEGYSIKWSKESLFASNELEETGLSYTISPITTEDLYIGATDYMAYQAILYYGEEERAFMWFELYDPSVAARIGWEEIFAVEGDEVTLTVSAYDYFDDEMNIAEDERYSFEWAKSKIDGYEPIPCVDAEYTFTVAEDDFYNDVENTEYVCDVYFEGMLVGTAYFDIINKETYIYATPNTYYVSCGESVTLEPAIYDYNDERVELNEEDYVVEWFQVTYNPETYEENSTYLGTGITYTVEEVSTDLCWSLFRGLYNYYVAYVYYPGRDDFSAVSEVYIEDIDYAYYGVDDAIYAEVGDDVEITAEAYDYTQEDKADLSGDEFTFEWYKVNGELEYEEVISTEQTLSITDVAEEDYEYSYMCYIYKNGEMVAFSIYGLADPYSYTEAGENIYVAYVGESITLKPQVLDYYGNEIDLSAEGAEIDWYVRGEDRWNYVTSGSTFTIDAITEDDFYDVEEDEYIYNCEVYFADRQWADVYFKICKKEKPIGPGGMIPETTTAPEVTTVAPTTKAPETTTVAPTTKTPETTTVAPTTAAQEVKAPAKAKVKKVTAKKKASKSVKFTLKKIKGAIGYQVQISKAKKFTKKNILAKKFTKKINVTVKSKKLKNKKKLFVRARAYVLDANGKKVYGKWSKVKKVKIK